MKIKVKQRDSSDCGAACLASVAAWFKVRYTVARIRQYASTGKNGTNILGMVEAAEKIGFKAKGVRGKWESLSKISKPVIAHLLVKGKLFHFVVIYKTTRKYIRIMDPMDGKFHNIPHSSFKDQWTGVLVLLAPAGELPSNNEPYSLYKKFIQLIKPHKTILFQVLCGALAYSILGLGISIYVGKLIDYVLPGENRNLLNLLGVAILLVIGLRILLNYFQAIFMLKTGQLMDTSLILGYYKHVQKLPLDFFNSMKIGEIISRIGDAVKIRTFLSDVLINLVLNFMILIVSFCLMFIFYPKLAFIMLLVIPCYILVYIISNILNRKTQRKVMESAAELESHLVESMNNTRTIKTMCIEDFINYKTESSFTELLKKLYNSGLNGIFSSTGTGLISQSIIIAVLWAGSIFVINHNLTAGSLISFYSIVGYFTGPVMSIIGFNRAYQDAVIAADRLFEILDLEEDKCVSSTELTNDMIGDIMFEGVRFRYGSNRDIFRNLKLSIHKSEITAIVGESGSGKTTISSLLLNIYNIQSGSIKIGNYDIRNFYPKTLRKVIGLVPQEIELFSGTIIENIALGDPSPDVKKVLSVCSSLGLTSFIDNLPQKYNTLLGEKGMNLSGGQRQRIAIARALYRDPEILILDEATSSLDPVSEQIVGDVLADLKSQDKTIIIIAHRISTVRLADKILFLEDGEIKEEGTYNDLLQSDGKFSKIFNAQINS